MNQRRRQRCVPCGVAFYPGSVGHCQDPLFEHILAVNHHAKLHFPSTKHFPSQERQLKAAQLMSQLM
jgi:hypothetical protein